MKLQKLCIQKWVQELQGRGSYQRPVQVSLHEQPWIGTFLLRDCLTYFPRQAKGIFLAPTSQRRIEAPSELNPLNPTPLGTQPPLILVGNDPNPKPTTLVMGEVMRKTLDELTLCEQLEEL
jgi:hypothetical protein